jgi:hypothetical protein
MVKEMLEIASQVMILACGLCTVYLTTSLDASHRRWASPIGLASQPFWFYSAYTTEAWGILFLSALYGVRWLQVFIRDYR